MKPRMFLFAPADDQSGGGGGDNQQQQQQDQQQQQQQQQSDQQQQQQDQQQAPTKPDWVPDKFWKDGNVDAEGLAKSYKHLESRFHKLGTDPAELPEKPEDYALKPEKLPEGVTWSDDDAKVFAETLHANGVSQKAASAIVEKFIEWEVGNREKAAQAYQVKLREDGEALRKEWGVDYHANLDKVTRMVTQAGYDANDPELFANPKVVKLLAGFALKLSEDGKAGGKGGAAPGTKFVNGADEAKAIMNNKDHPDHQAYMEGNPEIVKKVASLINGG